jgi:flagellar motor switch protein FliG
LVDAEAKLSGEQVHVDANGESKITDSLLQTLNQMSLGKDEEFIEDLRQSQPRIINAIQEKFWTMPQLRQTDQRALRTFISSQNNEVLFALLLVCPDQDRETLQEMIPEGMKKVVVLDLLKVAQAKNDEQERKVALRVVRETLNRARELHENGRLPFAKDVAT